MDQKSASLFCSRFFGDRLSQGMLEELLGHATCLVLWVNCSYIVGSDGINMPPKVYNFSLQGLRTELASLPTEYIRIHDVVLYCSSNSMPESATTRTSNHI